MEIAEKGYIGLGFKEHDFMEKVQKRKRDHALLREDPVDDDEERQKRYDTLYKLVSSGSSLEAIEFLCKDAFSSKPLETR